MDHDLDGLCHGNGRGIGGWNGLIGPHAAATASDHFAAAAVRKIRRVDREIRWRGIVNLSGRGMLVVSVARRLGSGNSFARLSRCPAQAERGRKKALWVR